MSSFIRAFILPISFLVVLSASYGEVITSEKYHFIAVFPSEVSSTEATHANGTLKTFQSFDDEKRILYIITANSLPKLKSYVPSDDEEKRELLEKRLESRLSTTIYNSESLKKEWTNWGSEQGLAFSYTSSALIEDELAYHSSISFYFPGFFYTLTVASFNSSAESEKALNDLLDRFSIATSLNAKERESNKSEMPTP